MIFFNRSSNSPRYLVPATNEPTSSIIIRLDHSSSGTSPAMTRCANPSTIAVLPTPGSPINTGLFLVRRHKIWIARVISTSRPMTGSISFCRAMAVRSRANESRVGVVLSRFLPP